MLDCIPPLAFFLSPPSPSLSKLLLVGVPNFQVDMSFKVDYYSILKSRHHISVPTILVLSNASHVDLIRPISDPQRAHKGISFGQESVLADPHAAVRLDSTVDNSAGHAGHHRLCHSRRHVFGRKMPYILNHEGSY